MEFCGKVCQDVNETIRNYALTQQRRPVILNGDLSVRDYNFLKCTSKNFRSKVQKFTQYEILRASTEG